MISVEIPPTILLIEDNDEIRDSYQRLLAANGKAQVYSFPGREEAESWINHRHSLTLPADLVVTDASLQQFGTDEEGIDFAIQLKGRFPSLPVCLYTGWPRKVAGVKGVFDLVVPKTQRLTDRLEACQALARQGYEKRSRDLAPHFDEYASLPDDDRDFIEQLLFGTPYQVANFSSLWSAAKDKGMELRVVSSGTEIELDSIRVSVSRPIQLWMKRNVDHYLVEAFGCEVYGIGGSEAEAIRDFLLISAGFFLDFSAEAEASMSKAVSALRMFVNTYFEKV